MDLFGVADYLLLFTGVGQRMIGEDDPIAAVAFGYSVRIQMQADASQLFTDLAAKISVGNEPYDPTGISSVGELEEVQPAKNVLPGTRSGSQGGEA